MAAQTYTHLNVGALSLRYQMTIRPDYFKTFQALSKIRQELTNFTLPRLQASHSFYYAFNNKDLVVKIQMDPTAVQNLFLLTPTYANLMNPANLQVFYEKYQEQNYNAIIKRFQIASNDQIDSLMGYFKYITARFVTYEDRGGDYEVNTFARLMLKAIDLSYNSLLTQVLFELAVRYITAYNEVNKKSCINYAAIAAPTYQARQQALCKGFNFLNQQKINQI